MHGEVLPAQRVEELKLVGREGALVDENIAEPLRRFRRRRPHGGIQLISIDEIELKRQHAEQEIQVGSLGSHERPRRKSIGGEATRDPLGDLTPGSS